jgi:hypothetical protein
MGETKHKRIAHACRHRRWRSRRQRAKESEETAAVRAGRTCPRCGRLRVFVPGVVRQCRCPAWLVAPVSAPGGEG